MHIHSSVFNQSPWANDWGPVFAPSGGLCVCSLRGIVSIRKQFIFFPRGGQGGEENKYIDAPPAFPSPETFLGSLLGLTGKAQDGHRCRWALRWAALGRKRILPSCLCGVAAGLWLMRRGACGMLPARCLNTEGGDWERSCPPWVTADWDAGGLYEPSQFSNWHEVQITSTSGREMSMEWWGETSYQLACQDMVISSMQCQPY